jgi:hypothetical protein
MILRPIWNLKKSYITFFIAEIDLLFRHAAIARYTRSQRIRRSGHIVKIDKERTVKRITDWRTVAVRRIGTQRLRWEDDIREDVGKMKVQNWSKMAMDRDAWRRTAEQAKTHKDL